MTKQIELYSFDVFDTLITRRVGVPKGIFAVMQEKLRNKISFPKDFYTIRIESERFAREIGDSREITFDDIYKKMQLDYNLSDKTIEYLKELELKTELENFVGIDENILKVKNLVEQGENIVLISDMYHSSGTIRMFLSHIDPVFEKIKIYVSSEYKATKCEGSLFKIVQKEENITPREWIHYGDNKESDVKKAKNLGIKAEHFEFPPLMEYEKELLATYPDNIDFQYLVGASRITRLNKSDNKEKYDFGASFTAPIVYNYVNWILEESLKKGFKTLHFIARDGYIPKIAADIIIQKRGLDIKTKYIYGSRKAWRVPDEENYEKLVSIIFNEYQTKLNLNFAAYRLGVDADKLAKLLEIEDCEKVFAPLQRVHLQKRMLENIEIKSLILNSNKQKAELLVEYLKQELDFNEENLVFVDINGSGRTQDILTKVIHKIKPVNIHTFYLTTSINDKPDLSNSKYTYCTEPKPHYHCLELLCRVNEGQTIGYEKSEGKIIPIKEKIITSILDKWGYNDYLRGISEFTQKALMFNNNNVELCYIYHDYVTTKCDSKTAEILGDIPFMTVGCESEIKQAAPALSMWQFIKHFFRGGHLDDISEFPFLTVARGNSITNKAADLIKKSDIIQNFIFEMRFLHLLKTKKNKKIMFWGASLWLDSFIKKYRIKNDNIVGIIDKNPNRQGCLWGKYKIYPPEMIKKLNPDIIVLTIKNRNYNIYHDLKRTIKKEFSNVVLEANIFEELWKI